MRLHTAGSERMRIDSSGRVGIGTSSPDFKAEIVGGTNDGLHIKDAESATVFGGLFTQSANLALVARSNHALTFGTNDAERMRIDSSGRVGIGTASPSSILHTSVSSGANKLDKVCCSLTPTPPHPVSVKFIWARLVRLPTVRLGMILIMIFCTCTPTTQNACASHRLATWALGLQVLLKN
jgi:hypothetical protein